MNRSSHTYSIRQVIALTGVSEFVLRAWENRYDALTPQRTKTGRRQYSKEDLLKARLLFELTQQDYKISSIAKLSLKGLQDLSSQHVHLKALPENKNHGLTHIEPLLTAAKKFSWDDFEVRLKKIRKTAKPRDFIYGTALPLIQEIGRLVVSQQFSIAQEHIVSAFLKENLSALKSEKSFKKIKMRLVLASPEGDFHEIGLLIASVLASLLGIKTLYLGPNVPPRELTETCIKFGATHLLLSSTISKKHGAKEDLLKFVSFLDQHLDKKISLWVAGPNTESLNFKLQRKHSLIHSFFQFEDLLSTTSDS